MIERWTPLVLLFAVIAASVWLGTLAQRAVKSGSFLKGYFLGNRGLGVWALALTATVQSGGTFMGFPSLVYENGWITALWISSYMILPITAFAVLGKRLAQVSRLTGALTVPDLLRERFRSPALGLFSSLFIVVFMTLFLLAQVKAGAVVMKIAIEGGQALTEEAGAVDRGYLIGLGVFSVSVILYTLIGGFLGAVWTDLLQSVLMLVGVLLLFAVTMASTGGLEEATRAGIAAEGPSYASGPGPLVEVKKGDPKVPFLPLGMAFSMFFFWVFSGIGVPASLVRVMATKSTSVLRRSVVALNVYNVLIYVPLILIAIAGRGVFADLAKPDEIIPRLALETTKGYPGGAFLGGLILAAPFGAVMATVSTFVVVITSGVVRDIYQRFINPEAPERTLKRLSRAVIVAVGVAAVAASIFPVKHLQTFIILGGGGAAAAFLVPVAMGLFWRRSTAAGALASMIAGAGGVLAFAVLKVPRPLGVDPFLLALAASVLAGPLVSLLTAPPPREAVDPLFEARSP